MAHVWAEWRGIVLLMGLGSSVLVLPYVDASGKMSHDSAYYLRLAANLLSGHGYYVGRELGGIEGEYFSTWPIGYPTLIAAAAFALRLDVFWASKLANLIAIAGCCCAMRLLIGPSGYLYGAAFLTGSMLTLSASTLSEAPFMAGLLLFGLALWRCWAGGGTRWFVAVGVFALGLFLLRYHGLLALMPISILALVWFTSRAYRACIRMLGVASGVAASYAGYLAVNIALTGHVTGQPRGPVRETSVELAMGLFKAQLSELNLVTHYVGNTAASKAVWGLAWMLSAVLYLVALRGVLRPRAKRTDGRADLWAFWALVGSAYWSSIVLLRWFLAFDMFDERILGPSTLMFVVAVLSYLEFNTQAFRQAKAWWLGIVVCSVAWNVGVLPAWALAKGNLTFPGHVRMIEDHYRVVEAGAALISNNDFVHFVRPDIHFDRLYLDDELVARIETHCRSGRRRIYVDLGRPPGEMRYTYEKIPGFQRHNRPAALLARITDCLR